MTSNSSCFLSVVSIVALIQTMHFQTDFGNLVDDEHKFLLSFSTNKIYFPFTSIRSKFSCLWLVNRGAWKCLRIVEDANLHRPCNHALYFVAQSCFVLDKMWRLVTLAVLVDIAIPSKGSYERYYDFFCDLWEICKTSFVITIWFGLASSMSIFILNRISVLFLMGALLWHAGSSQ